MYNIVWAIQAAALAAASFSVVTRASAIPDINSVDFADNGAPLPSIPAAFANDLGKPLAMNSLGQLGSAGCWKLGQLDEPGHVLHPPPPHQSAGQRRRLFHSNGELAWVNTAFFNGRAGFCRDTAGQIFATFVNSAVTYPPSCSPIQLDSAVASTWQNGAIVSGSSSASTRPTSRAPGGPITTTPFAVPTTAAAINMAHLPPNAQPPQTTIQDFRVTPETQHLAEYTPIHMAFADVTTHHQACLYRRGDEKSDIDTRDTMPLSPCLIFH
ncbi:wsc domain-containing protein [Colletotrichum incanum]|uniref:Wsc domain-containing protein n=1 Tax=Colletotrichum incanum TaxID=1573173 RepID=A0A162PYD6_COLIC|nr:wsc domain-containing protein [Colletotrichum incanum]